MSARPKPQLIDSFLSNNSLKKSERDDQELIINQNQKLAESILEEDFDIAVEPVEEGEDGEFCNSCYLKYREADFFALPCGHRFCLNCNRDHLQTKIKDGNAFKLPCMQFDCKEFFKPDHIQKFCTKDLRNKFETIRKDV